MSKKNSRSQKDDNTSNETVDIAKNDPPSLSVEKKKTPKLRVKKISFPANNQKFVYDNVKIDNILTKRMGGIKYTKKALLEKGSSQDAAIFKDVAAAKRYAKIQHYENVSLNQPNAIIRTSNLKSALKAMYEKIPDSDFLPGINESVIHYLKHCLNSIILNILTSSNLVMRMSDRQIIKERIMVPVLVNFSIQNSIPKLSEFIMLALNHEFIESIDIDGVNIPVCNIYKGSSLLAILVKSGCYYKSRDVKMIINRIASIFLYLFARDSYSMMESLSKKVLRHDIASLCMKESFKTKVYC